MNRPLTNAPWLCLLLAGSLSCASYDAAPTQSASEPEEAWAEYEMDAPADDFGYAGGAPAPQSAPAPKLELARSSSRMDKSREQAGADAVLDEEPEPAQAAEGEDAPTRAWFPESFLFEPLVVTDGDGVASLDVTVPDQLTDWRVLALAHSRDGAQAGTEARFSSTLPVYLDVAEPPTLRVGDRARLPLQVVNNQAEGFHGGLSAHVDGDAAWGSISGTLGVDAHGTHLEYVEVHAVRPGGATLKANLIATDQVVRSMTVVPTGRRLDRSQGGTLAASRSFDIMAPSSAQPGSSSLSLVVYPGPLAILAEEMGRSLPGAHSNDAAYGYALAGYGRDIALRLGQEVDESSLRKARIRAYQRLVRYTRSPDLTQAVVALAAARTQPDDELAQALTERLADQVLHGQSPDGSFAAAWTGGSSSLPRALVLSSLAARWTDGQRARVSQRAAGFVARNAGYVKDPYTASVILAAGLVEGPQAEQLVELVLEGVQVQPDGTRVVKPGEASQRLDGRAPGTVETTAWALLAMAEQDGQQDLVSDLAAALLGSYRPGRGFGDGLTGLATLEALAQVFDEPLPETVKVRLTVDGQELLERDMTLAGNYAPLIAKAPAPALAGPHRYEIEATPAVPGLAFTLTQTAYLPWKGDTGSDGFGLKVTLEGTPTVGETLPCRLQAAVPGGEPFEVELELPAGVEVERSSLQALLDQGSITAFDTSRGHLEISGPALASGAVFDATVELVPTLAGELGWGGAALALATRPDERTQSPVGTLSVAMR